MDESWLSREAPIRRSLAVEIVVQEKQMIEAALAKCKGRISGPTGAAEKLGMAPTTLNSEIKALRTNKHQYKAS